MSISIEQIQELSDDDLRAQLTKFGINFGPIGSTTRKLYEKKLLNFVTGTDQLRSSSPLRTADVSNGSRHCTPQPSDMTNGSTHASPLTINNSKPLFTQDNGSTVYISGSGDAIPQNQMVDFDNDVADLDQDEQEEVECGEESVRYLTPEEAGARFSLLNTPVEEEYDEDDGMTSSTWRKCIFILLFVVTSAVVFKIVYLDKGNVNLAPIKGYILSLLPVVNNSV